VHHRAQGKEGECEANNLRTLGLREEEYEAKYNPPKLGGRESQTKELHSSSEGKAEAQD